MTKSIASYPEHLRPMVVQRRMRNYDPKGNNGNGTLAAKAQYDRQFNKPVTPKKAKKASK